MSDPRPVQAGGWRELILGEEATAASEMVILLPVYLLMLTGLFMTGNMMQARQALVQAVRFEAWTQKQVNGANFDAFFHGIPGRYERVRDPGLQRGARLKGSGGLSMAQMQVSDLDTNADGSDDARRFGGLQGSFPYDENAAKKIAAAVLNNVDEGGSYDERRAPLALSQIEGTFTYEGILLAGMPGVAQTTQAAVLLEQDGVERPLYDADKGHPIATHWRERNRSFDPADYPPFSPYFDPYFSEGSGSGSNPGIWDVDARLKGSEDAEREYIRGFLKSVSGP